MLRTRRPSRVKNPETSRLLGILGKGKRVSFVPLHYRPPTTSTGGRGRRAGDGFLNDRLFHAGAQRARRLSIHGASCVVRLSAQGEGTSRQSDRLGDTHKSRGTAPSASADSAIALNNFGGRFMVPLERRDEVDEDTPGASLRPDTAPQHLSHPRRHPRSRLPPLPHRQVRGAPFPALTKDAPVASTIEGIRGPGPRSARRREKGGKTAGGRPPRSRPPASAASRIDWGWARGLCGGEDGAAGRSDPFHARGPPNSAPVGRRTSGCLGRTLRARRERDRRLQPVRGPGRPARGAEAVRRRGVRGRPRETREAHPGSG